ncbi:hypothetical protein [Streptomyces sp. NBC_00564]|uniref:hypothetical protein n=1 Tax=Streptomyces sp. NBC_00564 TaxID=2903663 RepID=UPI00352D5C86
MTAGARATYAVFAGLGLAGSTWSSRLPEVRTQLNLDSASLGLLLLTIAVGGVIVLPLSGTVVTRIGPAGPSPSSPCSSSRSSWPCPL